MDAFDKTMLGFMAVLMLTLAGIGWDAMQEYRSFDARVACEVRLMVPRRRPMEVTVTCVPIPTRQDTTTIYTPDIH